MLKQIHKKMLWLVPVLFTAIALPGLALDYGQINLNGQKVETQRHTIQLTKTGLPGSVTVKVADSELPLATRGSGQELNSFTLRKLGRGTQLQNMRIVGESEGKSFTLEPKKAVKINGKNDKVMVKGTLAGESLKMKVQMQWNAAGVMSAELTYGGNNVKVDSLSLRADLSSEIDFVLPVMPNDSALKRAENSDFEVKDVPKGVMWENAGQFVEERTIVKNGMLEHVFVGTGDSGFTFLFDGDTQVDQSKPFASIVKDEKGNVTVAFNLINKPSTLNKKMNTSVTMMTHPSRMPAQVNMAKAWSDAENLKAEKVSMKDFDSMALSADKVITADMATLFEPMTKTALLTGKAGGDTEPKDGNIVQTYPLLLHRYYMGTHASWNAVLRSNSDKLTTSGASPKADRMVLSRALLNNAVPDVSTIAQKVSCINMVKALDEFGYFENDGKTEFVPYWRNDDLFRYGESFDTSGRFEASAENPVANVKVSMYRRPTGENDKSQKVLFVVANETSQNQSEQFYCFDMNRIMAGPNSYHGKMVINRVLEEGVIPENSDWRADKVRSMNSFGKNNVLWDMEEDVCVQTRSEVGSQDIYGPIFVYGYDFRLLYAHSDPNDGEVVKSSR